MKITVTKKDIQNGRRENPWFCPIARAIKRQCKLTGSRVSIGARSAAVDYVNLDIPKSAQKFIDNFDNKKSVKPFSFYLVGA